MSIANAEVDVTTIDLFTPKSKLCDDSRRATIECVIVHLEMPIPERASVKVLFIILVRGWGERYSQVVAIKIVTRYSATSHHLLTPPTPHPLRLLRPFRFLLCVPKVEVPLARVVYSYNDAHLSCSNNTHPVCPIITHIL